MIKPDYSEKFRDVAKGFSSHLEFDGFKKRESDSKFYYRIEFSNLESLRGKFYYEIVEELSYSSNAENSVGISVEFHIEKTFEFAKEASSFFETLNKTSNQGQIWEYKKVGELGCISTKYDDCSLDYVQIISRIKEFIAQIKKLTEEKFHLNEVSSI